MNAYEEKQAARKQRFEELAAKARAEGSSTFQRAASMASVIPFGQPILVGHHSESRDRNYRARIGNTFAKAHALADKAKHYDSKANSVGTGGVSSDDPDALQKLRDQLAELESAHASMKAANKAIRLHATHEQRLAALVAAGFRETDALAMLTPDFAGRTGFPGYKLTNNGANMRRVKERIAELERRSALVDVTVEGNGFTYREDTSENRVMFIFPGKPSAEVRTILKRNAFKWSPSRNAWVRQLNNAGRWAAREVRSALDGL